jgi:hypothetical protein
MRYEEKIKRNKSERVIDHFKEESKNDAIERE